MKVFLGTFIAMGVWVFCSALAELHFYFRVRSEIKSKEARRKFYSILETWPTKKYIFGKLRKTRLIKLVPLVRRKMILRTTISRVE